MKTLFILNLTYKKDLQEVENYLEEHNQYLENYYSKGNFICSGRKNPRTGGIIISSFQTLDEAQEAIKDDPFYNHEIAEYSIVEFLPSKADSSVLKL